MRSRYQYQTHCNEVSERRDTQFSFVFVLFVPFVVKLSLDQEP
jgi:hypothetical protein